MSRACIEDPGLVSDVSLGLTDRLQGGQADQGKENAPKPKECAPLDRLWSYKRLISLCENQPRKLANRSPLGPPPCADPPAHRRGRGNLGADPPGSSKRKREPGDGPLGSSKRKREPSVQSLSVRNPPALSSSTARRPSAPSSSIVPTASSSTVPLDPRDLTLSDMLDDPWVSIGRYVVTDDMWHGPCFLYWF
jgi:hypothetical protein